MFEAARVGDMHTCPLTDGLQPHGGGPIIPTPSLVPTVFIGGFPAAVKGTPATCVGTPDVIIQGSSTVLIGGLGAARVGDQTLHGGMIVVGYPTVIIGG